MARGVAGEYRDGVLRTDSPAPGCRPKRRAADRWPLVQHAQPGARVPRSRLADVPFGVPRVEEEPSGMQEKHGGRVQQTKAAVRGNFHGRHEPLLPPIRGVSRAKVYRYLGLGGE
jgi:hypothetical protein